MKFLPYRFIDFASLIEGGFEYVDKTYYVHQLLRSPGQYFLARPHKFGKSLLLEALEAALRGRRELFKGLWLAGTDYDWRPSPVITLDLAHLRIDDLKSFNKSLLNQLKAVAETEELSIDAPEPNQFFQSLIEGLYQKSAQTPVATLIDNYDSRFFIEWYRDKTTWREIRQGLVSFLNVLNLTERYRGLTLIVGQTRLTASSNYPGARNLVDLTLDPRYANCCGFTLEEFDSVFAERLERELDEFKACGEMDPAASPADLRDKILAWHDGYSWDGRSRLLNPSALIKLFTSQSFDDHGVDNIEFSMLDQFLKKNKTLYLRCFTRNNYIDPGANEIDPQAFRLEPLLFQIGVLTCRTDGPPMDSKFNLVFPNLEIKWSLAAKLLSLSLPQVDPLILRTQARAVLTSLFQKNPGKFSEALTLFLSHYEFDPQSPVDSFLARIFVMAATLADQPLEPESAVRGQRLDLRLRDPESGEVLFLDFNGLTEGVNQKPLPLKALTRLNQRIARLKNPVGQNRLTTIIVLVDSAGQVTANFAESSSPAP
ncbi:MAG: AAA family ATPase [Deltaproteobacteria bacterium]|nr:AAA family ATPase [Deltaproteobacteria bacterium]